jgi:hypothetical protein
MALVLGATSIGNTASSTVTATVTVVDSNRNAVANAPVTITADNSAIVVPSGPQTDASGTITATIGIGADRSNRVITVTASSGSISRTASFAVTGAKLQASVQQSVIAPGAAGQIQYLLVDVTNNPMAGVPIGVTGAGITGGTGTTDTNGAFTFNYTAPPTPGSINISAAAGGVTSTQTVQVQAGTGTIPSVQTAISSASVSANPSVVAVNGGSSNNRTEIRALFQGANNTPIPNVRVVFDLNGDANNVGGTLSSASNVVLSDANGVATAAYIPGGRSSPTDGVTVRACYYLDDVTAAAGQCATFATTTLTVASDALAVTLGYDNTISDGPSGLTYVKKFVVLVVDSSGQGKADVQVTPSVDLVSYTKGFYDGPGAWNRSGNPPQSGVSGFTGVTCPNEDSNRNGVLDAGEDINKDGQLEPRKSDVSITMVGSSKTDSTGVAVLQIEYPKNVATWDAVQIMVSASGVSGTEGRATWLGVLPADSASFKSQDPPAFQFSPYGIGGVDTNGDGVIDCRDAN